MGIFIAWLFRLRHHRFVFGLLLLLFIVVHFDVVVVVLVLEDSVAVRLGSWFNRRLSGWLLGCPVLLLWLLLWPLLLLLSSLLMLRLILCKEHPFNKG